MDPEQFGADQGHRRAFQPDEPSDAHIDDHGQDDLEQVLPHSQRDRHGAAGWARGEAHDEGPPAPVGRAKALGNATRLELLDLFAQGERHVDALARSLGAEVTTTSAHLQVPKRAGLVSSRRDGVQMLYRLAGPDVPHLLALVRRVAETHRADVAGSPAAYLRQDADTRVGVGRGVSRGC